MKKHVSRLTLGLLIILPVGISACKKDNGTSATIDINLGSWLV